MLPLIVGGAALGAYKGYEDQQQGKRDRQAAAITAQWSPWTGMQPGEITKGSMVGGAMQGGLAGASFGQNMAQTNALDKWSAAQGGAPGTDGGAALTGDTAVAGNGAEMGPPTSAMMPKPVVAAPQAPMPYAMRGNSAQMGPPPWLMMQNQRTYGG